MKSRVKKIILNPEKYNGVIIRFIQENTPPGQNNKVMAKFQLKGKVWTEWGYTKATVMERCKRIINKYK